MSSHRLVVLSLICVALHAGCNQRPPISSSTQPGTVAAKPPVIYDDRLDPDPLGDDQVQEIVKAASDAVPDGQAIWYLHVHFNQVCDRGIRGIVTVYYAPTTCMPRIRKGQCVSMTYGDMRTNSEKEAGSPPPHELGLVASKVGRYAQVSLAESPFGKQVELPTHRLWPFPEPEGFSNADLVELVDWARTSPCQTPPPHTDDRGGAITVYLGVTFDGNEPIHCINREEDGTVEIRSGSQQAPLAGSGHILRCVKKDGKWVVLDVGMWVS